MADPKPLQPEQEDAYGWGDASEYYIAWDITLLAKNSVDAARKALAIHRDPQSIATVFDVTGPRGTTRVDLMEIDEQEEVSDSGQDG